MYRITWRKVLAIAFFFSLAAGLAQPQANPRGETDRHVAQPAADYEDWIRIYRKGPLPTDPALIHSASPADAGRPILNVTAIEGDDLKPDAHQTEIFGKGYRIVHYGCSVSSQGEVSYFHYSSSGIKGGGGNQLPAEDLQRLKLLLAKLPDDHAFLPPSGRRLVLQVPDGDQVLARVYDRANMPDAVLEILRLSSSRIRSWAPKFNVLSRWVADQFSIFGAITLTPDGKYVISSTAYGPFKFWDPETRVLVKQLPLWQLPRADGWTVTVEPVLDIQFSPDRSMVVIAGGSADVYDARTWTGLRKLPDAPAGRHGLLSSRFTPGGRFLMVESTEPALQVFDTRTWEQRAPLPEMPTGAAAYYPAQNGESAVYSLASGTISLWDVRNRRTVAQLDNKGRILSVAYSPDQTRVAMTTLQENVETKAYTDYRLRVWRTDSGELVHELRAFEQPAYAMAGLEWWPDGKYLLASARPDFFFTDTVVGVWDVGTGRFRGEFDGCPTSIYGIALVPDTKRLVEACSNGEILVWDAASAIEQIEKSH